jgi:putative transposase
MPRYARYYQRSNTNVYHIILRSINQQEIFYDDTDRSKFIQSLKNTKEKYQYNLYAYVLMDNPVHLLIRDNQNNLSKIIQSIATSYAVYFNKKYSRIGHVFYNRFKSMNVDTLSYFMNLIRYIHFNPEKAGMCKYDAYNWSSYQKYFRKKGMLDSNEVLQMAQMDKEGFKIFHKGYSRTKEFLLEDFEMDKTCINDETAIQKIRELLGIENLSLIQNLKPEKRDEIIVQIVEIKEIERKQLSRILGVNERAIYRAIKKNKEAK